jgi:sulfur-carrier protein
MIVTIKYFGVIVDITHKTEELFSFSENVKSVASLKEEMEATYTSLKNIHYRIAVNQTLSGLETTINNNDIIAFLPPFAGG